MKILIAGGTGFIGQWLIAHWHTQHDITCLTRTPKKAVHPDHPHVRMMGWGDLDAASLAPFDVLINLSGANVGEKRWTNARKAVMLDSRVKTTQTLASCCAALGGEAPLWINASGVGIYGHQDASLSQLPEPFDERSPVASGQGDFMADLACQWEQACQPAVDAGVRVICVRLAMVLGPKGGALKPLAMPVRMGMGCIVAGGAQPLPWVSMEDVQRAFEWMMQDDSLQGPVNLVAPGGVNHFTFMKMLGSVLHRPIWMPMPAWLMRLMQGEMADALVIHGQYVQPKRLLDAGFRFTHADLKSALMFACEKN